MPVTIRAVGMRVTARAIQIDLDGELHWLPKSQINSIDGEGAVDAIAGFSGDVIHEFVVTDWIAQQKGFTLGEEKFIAAELGDAPLPSGPYWYVRGDTSICFCDSQRDAEIIAAALNLTQGKI